MRSAPTDRSSRSAYSTDMSSLYADIGGPGSVLAAKMAVEDSRQRTSGCEDRNRSRADHQNKPDVGAQHRAPMVRRRQGRRDRRRAEFRRGARRHQVAEEKNKVFLVSGAGDLRSDRPSATPTRSTGPTTPGCSPTAPARRSSSPAATPGSSSPPTMPSATRWSATPRRWSRPTAARCVGSVNVPLNTQRFLVVPAAGAGLEGEGHRPRQRGRRHHQLDQAGAPNSASSRAARNSPACWCSSPTSTRSGCRPRRG